MSIFDAVMEQNKGKLNRYHQTMILSPRLTYTMTLAGYFGLLSLIMLWNTVIAPSPKLPVALILLFAAVPLLFPLRGLLHGRPSSNVLTALLSLFYFVHGVTVTVSTPGDRIPASLETVFSLLLFFGTTFYLRTLKRT